MKLSEKRKMFTHFLSLLIQHINAIDGYSCYLGDVFVVEATDSIHSKNSFHYQGLAADINLFYNGEYCTKTEDHKCFGDYWKWLHPLLTWGGDFKRKDGNHYSFGEGIKDE